MEKKEITELVDELRKYQEKVGEINNGKPKRKDMDKFKSYYEKTLKKLVEYIKFSKNKVLSEKAKELPLLKQLFSTFNIYMAFLIIVMIGPLALIVYLYTLTSYDAVIFTITGVDVLLIFFLVRKIQKESTMIIDVLTDAIPVVKNVAKLIEENNQSGRMTE